MPRRHPKTLKAVAVAAALAAALVAGRLVVAKAAGTAAGVRAAKPAGDTYVVVNVEGTVYTWIPWASEWTEATKGLPLPVGTLVQCLTPAAIELRRPGDGAAAKPLRINLTTPALFSLHANLARQFAVNGTITVDAHDVLGSASENGGWHWTDLLSIQDAWIRKRGISMFITDLATLARQLLNPVPMELRAANHPMQLRNVIRDVDVLYPEDGSVYFATDDQGLVLRWRVDGVSKPPALEVYVWRRDGARGAPLMTTNATIVPLKLARKGGYFLQLSSHDGSFQSRPVYFVLE